MSVVTSDQNLFRNVAAALGDEYRIVGDDPAGEREPDLILRHWAEPRRHESGTAPELVADLSLLSGDGLVDVVGRVLNGQSMQALPRTRPT